MKRPLRPEEARLWSLVAATVRPAQGRVAQAQVGMEPLATQAPPPSAKAARQPQVPVAPPVPAASRVVPPRINHATAAPDPIEPLRKRRIARSREPIEARLDLHGLDQDRARVTLHDFLRRAHALGFRAVLVITGKGTLGDGVLRRRAPDWLAEATVRPLIAGVSPAERRHGGEGALYIALKRGG